MHNMTSGNYNVAVGAQALFSCTSGTSNISFGTTSLYSLTTGTSNVAIGVNAMGGTQLDASNIGLGPYSLHDLGLSGAGGGSNQGNIAIGASSGQQIQTGNGNIFIGFTSCYGATGVANNNTIIGNTAGQGLGAGGTTISFNTMIGAYSGKNLINGSSSNTWIGPIPGPAAVVGNTIAISEGQYFLLDCDLVTSNIWSFSGFGGAISGIHIYGLNNGSTTNPTPTNYERGILDWHKTSNVFRISSEAGGSGTVRLIAIDGFQKAGAPAAGDLPSGTYALINDTSGGQTWLCYNAAGTIRKVQLT